MGTIYLEHQDRRVVVVLVLVGLQGSGKTTFRSRLEQCDSLEVVGVSQDVLGTRDKCIDAFRRALLDDSGSEQKDGGKHKKMIRFIVVDRTNLSKDQRRVWTDEIKKAAAAGRGGVEKSLALFWDMPVKYCAKRAADREIHEGGLHGNRAYPVIIQSSKRLQRPVVAEEDFDALVTFTRDEDASVFADHLINVSKEFLETGVLDIDTKVHRKGRKNAFHILMSSQRKKQKPSPLPQGHSFGRFRGWDTFVKYTSSVPRDALYSDEQCIVIRDKFPKARQHFLTIARCSTLDGPLSLKQCHVSLLRHMKDVSYQVISNATGASEEEMKALYQMGFHSAPSLPQLHMHVISKDFNSECLKTKKHWTSFTNPRFFLSADDVLADFERGIPALEYNLEEKHALLRNTPLTCPVCHDQSFRTLPEIKDHYHRRCFTDGTVKMTGADRSKCI